MFFRCWWFRIGTLVRGLYVVVFVEFLLGFFGIVGVFC